MQLISWRDGAESRMLAQSALGLVDIWNELPAEVVNVPTVQVFQSCLSSMMKGQANLNSDRWWIFSRRATLFACSNLEPSLLDAIDHRPRHPAAVAAQPPS